MWARYRKDYGSGAWSRWHATQGTEDDDRALCGQRLPVERLESVERKPRSGECANCRRKRGRRAPAMGRRRGR